MNKKTLHELIKNNIEELENLVTSFSAIESHKVEVKLIYSKLQILKDEIEILADMKDEKSVNNLISEVKEEDFTEVIKEVKEIEESTNSKVEIIEVENGVNNEEQKEPEKNTIEKQKESPEDKLIIKSSKPKKEKVRRRIERVKKETQNEIEAENKKIIEQAEIKTDEREKEIKEKEPDKKKIKKEKLEDKHEKSGIVADKFEVTKQSINDIIANSKKAKDIASMLKDKPIANLKKAVSINDKIRFTKELFDGKSENYQTAVDKLNNSADLDEALEYLNKNFVWDQEKESFREFLELIYRRFVNQ